MSRKVYVRNGESVENAIRRLRSVARVSGVLAGRYVRITDRNRQKFFFEKPGVKRRRKQHIAEMRRRYYQRLSGGYTPKRE